MITSIKSSTPIQLNVVSAWLVLASTITITATVSSTYLYRENRHERRMEQLENRLLNELHGVLAVENFLVYMERLRDLNPKLDIKLPTLHRVDNLPMAPHKAQTADKGTSNYDSDTSSR
jgi:hypothetical protein